MKLDDLFKNLCFLLTLFYWKFTMENWTPIYSHTQKKKKFAWILKSFNTIYHTCFEFPVYQIYCDSDFGKNVANPVGNWSV